MDGDNVTMLDTEVVANDTIDAGASIIQVIVCENEQDGVFPLLALDQDSVTAEELKSFHGVIRKGDDGVVIVGGIGDNQRVWLLLLSENSCGSLIVLLLLSTRGILQVDLAFVLCVGRFFGGRHGEWSSSTDEGRSL